MNGDTIIEYVTRQESDNIYATYGYDREHKTVCECRISVEPVTGAWTISSWFTREGYKHRGYGKTVLKECVDSIAARHPAPQSIRYIWNGQNEYVLKWLVDRFNAECTCPVAVQKYTANDDWESHMYKLDAAKFMNYIECV